LYYSIHIFDWERIPSNIIRITDTYDFGVDKNYWGVEGMAINSMVLAQASGILVPYYIVIVQ